ncbi:MAG: right-handed parallel beta-helix repeat-containing protein [Anaerolineae bacterium]|nr:right-handed parallel beta-helix repeat-containing protein [Anaerolineae bacterium]
MTSGRTMQHSIVVALLFAMSWTFVAARPAAAATIVVDGVTCTLADAITAANSDTATGGCPAGSGADTLDLVADITLTSRLPAIVSNVTILGNNHTVRRDPVAPEFGILWIESYHYATIDNITLTGGRDGSGGAILALYEANVTISNSRIVDNSAYRGGGIHCDVCYITLSNSVISNNRATTLGGGINGRGVFRMINNEETGFDQQKPSHVGGLTVQLRNSTLSNNEAPSGGGLAIEGVGTFRLESSTVHGNSAVLGGGIYCLDSDGYIESSTFSSNTADQKGGAIFNHSSTLQPNHGLIELRNSTITNNSSPVGSGLYNQDDGAIFPPHQVATLRPYNSILAAQADGIDCVNVGKAVVESQGFNIESATSCGFTAAGDQQNVTAAQLNLAPLANNGGTTWTHALIPGSAAIDQGNCPDVTADQRGFPRPVDLPGIPNAADGCDVGAYEAEAPLAVTVLTFEAEDLDSNSPPLFLIVAVLVTSLLLVTRWKNGRRVAANRHLTMPHSSQER